MPVCAAVLLIAISQFAQSRTGELQLTITDPARLPLAATVELLSEVNQIRERLVSDESGAIVAKRLPFGVYRLTVTRDGFAPFVGAVEIRSALPTVYHVTMTLAPLQTQLTVTPGDTLLDPQQTTSEQRIGLETVRARATALPGRSIPDLVDTQPGWLLEANGILHPRGSEYQTQYVVDGLPLTDNRSPAFAPEIDLDQVRALNIITGGYPAEYGRKLGGVIEIVTSGDARQGFHGSVAASAASFSTKSADANGGYSSTRTSVDFAAGGAWTDRYLDPPVEENFTNDGRTSHAAARIDRNLTESDRLGMIVRFGRSRFSVPNELIQQEAGQRQTRDNEELSAQFSYQHIFSQTAVADVQAMTRDLSARLASNGAATPIIAQQDRGLRDLYVKATASLHAGVHEWKVGADMMAGSVRERFTYRITDPDQFAPDTPSSFAFDADRADREQSVFVQDHMSLGQWTVNAGLRWDHYRLVVDAFALSPRIGVAWSWPDAGLVIRGSYDRAVQTPAVENLLLASSPAVDALSDQVLRLPLRPSFGNFYEAGLSKTIRGLVRVDATVFARHMTNFADDDLLLNTGVSFPIAFSRASVNGVEFKLDLPHWRAVSGSASYGLMKGVGALPITGGLFLGSEASDQLTKRDTFPVTQDQRHTIRGRVAWQPKTFLWFAAATAYGSGLPVEFEGSRDQAVAQYGARIVDRVDFEAGRVKPAFSMDGSVALVFTKSSTRSLRVQLDVRNVTNELNVINFAGLFSGTAIGALRSVAVRVRGDF
jgi:outer membrane cobalamin receptor